MNRLMLAYGAVCAVVATMAVAPNVGAQVVTYYPPVTYQPRVTYYAPPVAVAPAPYTVASPVVVTAAAPVVAPAPVVTYYRAPSVAYAPVGRVVTRHRPLLGGTVSRVRYSYMPVVVP